MDKETVLKAFYQSQINTTIEKVNDLALLDYIYKLLAHYQREETT